MALGTPTGLILRRPVASFYAAVDNFEGVAVGLPRFIDACTQPWGYLSLATFEDRNARAPVKSAA